MAEALLADQVEAVAQKLVELALAGDVAACRCIVERLVPPAKDGALPPGAVRLPPLRPENMAQATAAVVRAVAGGRLTPSEGQALAGLLEGHRKTLELVELEERLSRLETLQAEEKG